MIHQPRPQFLGRTTLEAAGGDVVSLGCPHCSAGIVVRPHPVKRNWLLAEVYHDAYCPITETDRSA